MSKSTYQNIVTVPGSTSDTIADGNIGGDIVTNFKALADKIHPDNTMNAINVAGGDMIPNSFDSMSGDGYPVGTRLINNNIQGSGATGGIEDQSGSGEFPVAGGSGAFMKGILLTDTSTGTNYKLINVPYAGGMIVRYDILAGSGYGSVLYTDTGEMQVFDEGIDGAPTKNTTLGAFSVQDGDLYFRPTSHFAIMQIGLHGTILCGYSTMLVSGQNSSVAYGMDESSSW